MDPTEEQKRAFAKALATARYDAGLSVPELARRTGVSHQKLYQWEQMKGSPRDGDDLAKVEGELGTDGRLAAILGASPWEERVSRLEEQMAAQQKDLKAILAQLREGRGSRR